MTADTALAGEPVLDADDIQGHVLPGFRRPVSLLVGLAIGDAPALRAIARAVAPRVTSLREAFAHKLERKARRRGERGDDPPARPFLAIAFSSNALGLARGGAELAALDESFGAGMGPTSCGDASAPRLPDGSDNPSAKIHWRVGNDARPLDALLVLAGETADELDALYAALAAGWRGLAARETYREPGARLPGDQEHFGFRDGISMPGVFGRVDGPEGLQPLTTRHGVPAGPDGVRFGRPGQPLAWPAQFLFGTHASATRVAPAPALARHGSLLVFRRLAQDVAAFRRDTAAIAAALSGGANGVVGEDLARAWLVGRWPDGEPVVRSPGGASGAPSFHELDDFTYAGDPDGVRCPLFAHVRKVNPRDRPTDQGPPSITRSMQMLRRGVAYGPLYDHAAPQHPANAHERGLLFLSYQTSITNQLERIQTRWANQANVPEQPLGSASPGHDAIIGMVSTPTRVPGPRFVRRADRSADVLARWVTLTGGGYLFAPGLSALRHLAE